jgi:hypothetical protein
MKEIASPGLVDKAKRAYRAQRKRNPSLPALIPAAGEIRPGPGSAIFVVLATIGGYAVVTKFTPHTGWSQRPATPLDVKKLGLADADSKPTLALEDELRKATDVFLAAAAAVEHRTREEHDFVFEAAEAIRASNLRAARKGNGAGIGAPHNQLAAE